MANSVILSVVTIRSKLSLLIANYSKNRKDRPLQELYHNCNERRLGLEEVRRYRRDSRKARKVGKRGRRKD